MWHAIGIVLSPLKHIVFRVLSLVRPSVRPRVAIICGNEILLVRNWGDRRWSLPGGGAKRGESIPVAAARECFEEVGVKISAKDLILVRQTGVESSRYPVFAWKISKKPTLSVREFEITGVMWTEKTLFPPLVTEVEAAIRRLNF